jgi:hypothetical protein
VKAARRRPEAERRTAALRVIDMVADVDDDVVEDR